MSKNRILKFENVNRVAELNPIETLKRAGLNENMVVCDIGAGTGVFTFPATELTNNQVHALEISDEMIELLEIRKIERGIENLQINKVISERLPLNDAICDMTLMVTVLHEIGKPELLLNEIKRIQKPTGKLVIIEFHKKTTPMGPPEEHRMAAESIIELCDSNGFMVVDQFNLGDNLYCIVFEVQ